MQRPIDPTVAELVNLLDDDLAELFQERAAVREYDGGYARAHAEALALLDVINRHPEALSGVTVFAFEIDGATTFIVTTDRDFVCSVDGCTGTQPKVRADLARVLRNSFGGKARLEAVDPGVHV